MGSLTEWLRTMATGTGNESNASESEPATRPHTTLYECEHCQNVYVAVEKHECSKCRNEVEQVASAPP